ncbi:carbamoyltransferase HypF [Nonomuraea sp. NPDC049421]|uniref:carbamoyltransferase HypF n=1 Tax=Nonomuraea sp. NPDC049421 TaxID=3155275 RepID=UPI003443C88B
MTTLKRVDVHVEGIVQGVGFRPFVHSLANRLGLSGRVRGDVTGVHIEVEGACQGVEEFLTALERDAPALSEIERVTVVSGQPAGHRGFTIAAADPARPRAAATLADTATCDDCLRELADPDDRRHRYPFTGCANCGPRLSITRALPGDRPHTTMAPFTMCADCAREHDDPNDRRHRDPATCCPACGPTLTLRDPRGTELCGDPIACAAALLRAGRVVAVKGFGGYHLAVAATDERAAATLRGRKHRAEEPFTVMAADLAQARQYCAIDDTAATLLTSPARPVVLLPLGPDAPIAPSVASPAVSSVASSGAPGRRTLGITLPASPLHHLLLAELGAPLALTGGDVAGEPLAYEDADALTRLSGIADAFLTHDRAIHGRADDTVLRPIAGEITVLRRGRGHAPAPITLRRPAPRPVLACGATVAGAFCLLQGRRAHLSQYLGDLDDHDTLRTFTATIDHYQALLGIHPEIVAHDAHPGHLATRHALELTGVDHVAVQHHHAHVAACLADNGDLGPVIGVVLDGLGHGPDGTLWGGEFLRADLTGYQRLAHLAPVPMPGGPAAARRPWRMAAAYLRDRLAGALQQAGTGQETPLTSSAGHLFDAVAALLGLRDTITYEGQSAAELEQLTDPAETGAYPAALRQTSGLMAAGPSPAGPTTAETTPGGLTAVGLTAAEPVRAEPVRAEPVRAEPVRAEPVRAEPARAEPAPGEPAFAGLAPVDGLLVLEAADLVRAAADDLTAGTDPAVIAGRFHNGLAAAVTRTCAALRQATGLTAVALTGALFQNALLLERTLQRLRAAGFRVLRHVRVPPGDGGLSLGQAAVAAARDHPA